MLSRQIRRTNVSREEVKASIKEEKAFLSKMEQHRLSLETQLHACNETKGYVIPPTQIPQQPSDKPTDKPTDKETKPPPLTQAQIDKREEDIAWLMRLPRQKPNYIWNPCVQLEDSHNNSRLDLIAIETSKVNHQNANQMIPQIFRGIRIHLLVVSIFFETCWWMSKIGFPKRNLNIGFITELF